MLNVKTFSLFLGVTFLIFSPPVQAATDDIEGVAPKLSVLKNMREQPNDLQEELEEVMDTKPSSGDSVDSISVRPVLGSSKSAPFSRPPEFGGVTCFPANRYNRPPEVDGAGAKVWTTRWSQKGKGDEKKLKRHDADRVTGIPVNSTVPGDPRRSFGAY
ncbi:hypothetical protein OAN21_02925 [Alphaproteobacteria bacterium]|nr:hypothetical protein [Alphaproteobacteria bacterium]